MQNEFMTITDNDGKEIKCRIIFTYFSEEFKHNYVVFQVGDTDEITAMLLEETDAKNGKLMPIESDDEWDMLQDVLEDYFEKQEEEHHHGCGCSCSECCEGDCCDDECDCEEDHCGCGCHDCE